MTRTSFIAAVFALLGLACVGAVYQSPRRPPAKKRPTSDPVTALRSEPPTEGTLPNGLRYVVQARGRGQRRVALQLLVGAGWLFEDADQTWAAHLIEHLAFRETQHFPSGSLRTLLDGMGLGLGHGADAHITGDATTYRLLVPTDDRTLLDSGLRILRDWASAPRLTAAAIDKERKILVEEQHLRRDGDWRVFGKLFPAEYQGAAYSARVAASLAAETPTTSAAAVERYYREWYRPDLMTVVAVGDLDPAPMVDLLTRELGGLVAPAAPPRSFSPRPVRAETLVAIEADPEATGTWVMVSQVRPRAKATPEHEAARELAQQLYLMMFSQRLEVIWRQPDGPFLEAHALPEPGFGMEGLLLQASVTGRQGHVERALTALVEEKRRVDQHGFATQELARAKKQLASEIRQRTRDRSSEPVEEAASRIRERIRMGKSPRELASEPEFVARFLAGCDRARLSQLTEDLRGSDNRVVRIGGPDASKLPGKAAVSAALARADRSQVAAGPDRDFSAPVVRPVAAPVVSGGRIGETDIYDWRLANGVRVLVKPTRFNDDQVLLKAFSRGGHSMASDADFDATRLAPDLVMESGFGGLDLPSLRQATAGTTAWITLEIDEVEESLSAESSAELEDLRTMLELVYLSFTGVRADAGTFRAWRERRMEEAQGRRRDPRAAFHEDVELLMAGGHPRFRPTTPETFAHLQLVPMLAAYRARFADASDFTFVIVGNFDRTKLQPLVETYLGGLPSRSAAGRPSEKEEWRDVGVHPPRGPLEKVITMGRQPTSDVALIFMGPFPSGNTAYEQVRTLADVLENRLFAPLREDMAGIYTGGVELQPLGHPTDQYAFKITFPCVPANVAPLRQRMLDEIGRIAAHGVDEKTLENLRHQRTREHERNLVDNSFWSDTLLDCARSGCDFNDLESLDLRSITSDGIQQSAQRYLRPDSLITVVRNPQP
jgi:zinc protease